MIGETISHYKIIEKLGQGGMGVVYKAEDTKLNRFVALKFLPPDLVNDAQGNIRFLREARAAAALDHPNIATVHEIVESDSGSFISMAFIEGITLKHHIKSGPIAISKVIEIAKQIAEGLREAHQNGIIHRDMKSANIMVNKKDQVKITDFGLAKIKGEASITKSGSQMGTTAYMSPEQIRSEPADQQSDIFSFGVIMYEMLTAKMPFHGDYEQAIMYSILFDKPPAITEIRSEAPSQLQQIVDKAMKKEKKERYQSVEDILNDLAAIEENVNKKPVRQAMFGKIPLLKRRSVPPILLAISFMLVVLIVGIILFYPEESIPFNERDWILITDFTNLTGEEIFDKSLNIALSVSISQSPYVNVFPKSRIEKTLTRMKREDVDTIDEIIGREISLRESVKLLLLPSISRVGETYAVTAVIQNPVSGEALKSEIIYAESKDDVLSSLDRLSEKIRNTLGETIASISNQSKSLSRATTTSLEALKYFSLANEKNLEAKFDEARRYYHRALNIDSNFTSARASLGLLYLDVDREKGLELLNQAAQKADQLTNREKYGILAFHAQHVEKDLQKAADYHIALLALHPDLSNVHNNLAIVYKAMGHYEDAAREYKEAIRIDPYLMIAYNGLSNIYLWSGLGQLDSALVWCKRQISYNPDHFWAYYHLGWTYIGLDSLISAEMAYKKAIEINPRQGIYPQFTWDLIRLGYIYQLQGRYMEAIQTFQEVPKIDPTQHLAHYYTGLVYDQIGEEVKAQHYFKLYYQKIEHWLEYYPDNGMTYIALGLVLTRLGQKERAWSLGKKAIEIDSTLHIEFAQLLCAQGKLQEAINRLEMAVRKGVTSYIWIKIQPDFEPLYEEPRFQAMLKKAIKR
jgi:serine/threonine protein kinase